MCSESMGVLHSFKDQDSAGHIITLMAGGTNERPPDMYRKGKAGFKLRDAKLETIEVVHPHQRVPYHGVFSLCICS